MRVTEAKYSKKSNLGNYESEEFGLVAVIEEDEDHMLALKKLKEDVAKAAEGEYSSEEQNEVQDPKPKTKKSKKQKSKLEDDEDVDSDDVEDGDEDSDKESEDNEEDDTDSREEGDEDGEESDSDDTDESKLGKGKVAASSKTAPAKKKFKKKPEVYDRTVEVHKELFAEVMSEVAPKWRDSKKSKAQAKDVSSDMEGQEFLDENGEVLKSFKAAVKKAMK